MTLHISKAQTAYLVVVVVLVAAAAIMAVVVAVMAVHVYNNNNFKMLKTNEQVIAIGYLYFL